MPAKARKKIVKAAEKLDESSEISEVESSDNEYYGENEPKAVETAKVELNSNSNAKNISFFFFMAVFVVIISAFTAINMQKMMPSIDGPIQDMNQIVTDFKTDLRREREIMLKRGDGYDTEIKKTLNIFYEKLEKSFITKAEVQAKIQKVQGSLDELKSSSDEKLKSIEDTLKNQRNDVSEKVFDGLRKEMGQLMAKIEEVDKKHTEKADIDTKRMLNNLREINKAIANVENEVGNLKAHADHAKSDVKREMPENGNLVTKEELFEQIKNIQTSLFSPQTFHAAMSAARDGDNIDWASLKAGGNVETVAKSHRPFFSARLTQKNEMISAVASPGDCYAFKPTGGNAYISLREAIVPSAFTYETVHPAANPSKGSGPRLVRVSAVLKSGELYEMSPKNEPFELSDRETSQTFDLKDAGIVVKKMRFDFLSNYGHSEYTCVYRIRVHGKPAPAKE